MGLEDGTYINDLVITNPVGATDERRFGDDHLRLIKKVLKNTFPDAISASPPLRFEHRTTTTTLQLADKGKYFVLDAATDLSFAPPAGLGNGWWCMVRNNAFAQGTRVTLHTTINGLTPFRLYPGEDIFISCDGSLMYGFGLRDKVLLDYRATPYPLGIEFAWIGTNEPRFTLFQLEWENLVPAAMGATFQLQVSTNGGVSWIATPTYQHVRHFIDTDGRNVAEGFVNDTKVVLATALRNDAQTEGAMRLATGAGRVRWELDYVASTLAMVSGWSTIPYSINAVKLDLVGGGPAATPSSIVRLYGMGG